MSYVAIPLVLLALLAWLAPVAAAGLPRAELTTAAAAADKVNINTADARELTKLQGVSRSLAEKIVQYRDAHGPFKKAADLRKVDGVGDGVWEKNRQRIVVK